MRTTIRNICKAFFCRYSFVKQTCIVGRSTTTGATNLAGCITFLGNATHYGKEMESFTWRNAHVVSFAILIFHVCKVSNKIQINLKNEAMRCSFQLNHTKDLISSVTDCTFLFTGVSTGTPRCTKSSYLWLNNCHWQKFYINKTLQLPHNFKYF